MVVKYSGELTIFIFNLYVKACMPYTKGDTNVKNI